MLGKLIHIFSSLFSTVFNPQEDRQPETPPLTQRTFAMPEDPLTLHPAARRRLAICNLFANENRSIGEIAKLLDTKTSTVISALLKEELIPDRRQSVQPVEQDRRSTRKYHLPSTRETGRSNYFKALCGVVGEETVSEYVFLKVIKNHEGCDECWVRYSQLEHDPVSASEEATAASLGFTPLIVSPSRTPTTLPVKSSAPASGTAQPDNQNRAESEPADL